MRQNTQLRSSAPRPRALSSSIHRSLPGSRQQGLGMVEVILGLGILGVIGAASYTIYRESDVRNTVGDEQENIKKIAENAHRIYGSTGSYTGISIENAIQKRIVPRPMVVGEGASAGIASHWGQPVLVTAANIDGVPNTGVRLTYQNTPNAICPRLVHATADVAWDIEVNGKSVYETGVSGEVRRGKVDQSKLMAYCTEAQKSSLVFILNNGESGLSAQVLAPVSLPAMATPPVGGASASNSSSVLSHTPPFVNNLGASPSFTVPFTPLPTAPGTAPSWTATPVSPSAPAPFDPYVAPSGCTVPPAQTRLCDASGAEACDDGSLGVDRRNNTNVFNCPAGQRLNVAPYDRSVTQTRPETRKMTERRTASCPDPYAPAVWTAWKNTGDWSGWVADSPWSPPINGSCVPECSAPSDLKVPQSTTAACPAGQVTASGASSFTQTRMATTTYSCPSPIGAYTTHPSTYTDYLPTIASVCAPACVKPNDWTETEAGPREIRTTTPCPSGQLGVITESRPSSRSRLISYSCPSPQGSYVTTTPPWGDFAGVGGWSEDSRTCAPICTPYNVPQSRAGNPVTQPGSCPPGQTGTVTMVSPSTQSRVVNYTCPAPTGNAVPNDPDWGAPVATGAWTQQSASCTPAIVCPAVTMTVEAHLRVCKWWDRNNCQDGASGSWVVSYPSSPGGQNNPDFPGYSVPGVWLVNGVSAGGGGLSGGNWYDPTEPGWMPPPIPMNWAIVTVVSPSGSKQYKFQDDCTLGSDASSGSGGWCNRELIGYVGGAQTVTDLSNGKELFSSPLMVSADGGWYFDSVGALGDGYSYGATNTTWDSWSNSFNFGGLGKCVAGVTCRSVPQTSETKVFRESRVASCPSGYVTASPSYGYPPPPPMAHRDVTKSRTSEPTICPASGMGAGLTYWGPWSVVSETPWVTDLFGCVKVCTLPTPNPVTETVAGGKMTRPVDCSSLGMVGPGLVQESTSTKSRQVTYACPSPTGPAVPNDPAWGAPVSNGDWSTVSGSCSPPAPSSPAYTWKGQSAIQCSGPSNFGSSQPSLLSTITDLNVMKQYVSAIGGDPSALSKGGLVSTTQGSMTQYFYPPMLPLDVISTPMTYTASPPQPYVQNIKVPKKAPGIDCPSGAKIIWRDSLDYQHNTPSYFGTCRGQNSGAVQGVLTCE